MRIKTGLGEDSHRFDLEDKTKKLILGGVIFEDELPLLGNSDADVVYHALCNAISGVTSDNVLGEISDILCFKQGISDSSAYVREALAYLEDWEICHASFSIECLRPRITPKIPDMRKSISRLLRLNPRDIGITATTGEGLTAFGRGEGIHVSCIVTAVLM
jgi:2-C-methyl-D-erythritol 2,4-cyclodiphosphate synthase